MNDLRYPIGQHDVLAPTSRVDLEAATRDIQELPVHLRTAVAGLDGSQLGTAYRPDGWTVCQPGIVRGKHENRPTLQLP